MTADRTTKFLLSVIALLLTGMLARPMLTPLPAQAQSSSGSLQMVEDKGIVYVTKNDMLLVYRVQQQDVTGRPVERANSGNIQLIGQKQISRLREDVIFERQIRDECMARMYTVSAKSRTHFK